MSDISDQILYQESNFFFDDDTLKQMIKEDLEENKLDQQYNNKRNSTVDIESISSKFGDSLKR